MIGSAETPSRLAWPYGPNDGPFGATSPPGTPGSGHWVLGIGPLPAVPNTQHPGRVLFAPTDASPLLPKTPRANVIRPYGHPCLRGHLTLGRRWRVAPAAYRLSPTAQGSPPPEDPERHAVGHDEPPREDQQFATHRHQRHPVQDHSPEGIVGRGEGEGMDHRLHRLGKA